MKKMLALFGVGVTHTKSKWNRIQVECLVHPRTFFKPLGSSPQNPKVEVLFIRRKNHASSCRLHNEFAKRKDGRERERDPGEQKEKDSHLLKK